MKNWSIFFLLLLNLLMFVRPRTKATTYEPIRITFDTSYLSSDPGKICLNTGEKIRRGTPATSNIWCGGFTENCYLNCTQFDLVTYANTVPYFQELLAYAKTEVEKVIKVNRLTSSLKANSTTCGNTAKLGVNVPNSMIVTGSTNTDLYIIVTFRPMLSSEKESFSFDCLTDSSSNDRPILGHMNLNPKDFIAVSKETAQRRVLHEVIHLLGFSKNKFLTYKTELGVPRTSVTNTIATSHNGETVQITYLTLPTVMALGKKFFGCSLYQGAQLEDLTGNDDHLEKKIYYNDIMTGDLSTIAGPSAMISPFTLAILADSGYYEVNYDYTSEYTWGQGLGCEFVNNRCEDWAKIKNIDGYFCGTTTGNDNNHCTYDFNSKGVCDAVYYSTAVRNFFQHFTDNRLAGPIGSDIRNLCPLYKTLSSSDCRLTPAPGIVIDYENTGQQYSNIRADLWSKSSFQVRDSKIARCHQYACENGTNLYVKIGQNWINCPSEETLTAIPGFSGALYCPNIRQICPENFTSPHFSTRISDPSLNQNENLWITGVLVFVQKIPSYVWVMWILLAISIIFVLITIAIWRIVHRRVYKKKDEDAVYVEDETREYYEEMERRDMEDLEMELKKKEKQQEIAQQYAGDEDIELKQIDIFEDQNKEVANSEKTTSIPILNLDESTTQNYDENVVKKDNYSDTSDDEDVKKKKKSKTIIIQDGSDNSEEVKKKKKKKKKKHYEEEEDQQEEQNEVVEEDFEEKKMKKKKSKKKFEDNFEDNEEQVEEKKKKKKKKKKHYEEDEEEEIENLEVEEETKKKKKKKKKKHLEEEEEEEESQQQQQENEDDTQEETKKKKKKKKKKYVEEEEEEEE